MPIPPSTAPFFQEYEFESLDVHAHSHLIIERILAYGSRAEVRWLVAREFFKHHFLRMGRCAECRYTNLKAPLENNMDCMLF
jgi:hypothetical protein